MLRDVRGLLCPWRSGRIAALALALAVLSGTAVPVIASRKDPQAPPGTTADARPNSIRSWLEEAGGGIPPADLVWHWVRQTWKLSAALVLGAVFALYRRRQGPPSGAEPWAFNLALLCLGGALLMIIVGDSLARAFSIGGAAGLVRFRTKVRTARDGVLLFLVLGVGMACGMGHVATALVATALILAALETIARLESPQDAQPRDAAAEDNTTTERAPSRQTGPEVEA